ncbi:MAG: nitroreductase [Massilibacillus sp.]|jgi:nitroreductase|nr:nitroreductase [Massilibacillus sp.]
MNELLRNGLMRRNSRNFDTKQISDSELTDIIEAGKFVSNMINNQEWNFTIIQNVEILNKINELCSKLFFQNGKEKLELLYNEENLNFLFNAPTLIIISGKTDDEETQNAAHATFGNMMLVADKMGIGACWNYSLKCMFDTEEGKTLAAELGIKNGYVPMSVGVFGYKTTRSAIHSLSKENLVQIIK